MLSTYLDSLINTEVRKRATFPIIVHPETGKVLPVSNEHFDDFIEVYHRVTLDICRQYGGYSTECK